MQNRQPRTKSRELRSDELIVYLQDIDHSAVPVQTVLKKNDTILGVKLYIIGMTQESSMRDICVYYDKILLTPDRDGEILGDISKDGLPLTFIYSIGKGFAKCPRQEEILERYIKGGRHCRSKKSKTRKSKTRKSKKSRKNKKKRRTIKRKEQ